MPPKPFCAGDEKTTSPGYDHTRCLCCIPDLKKDSELPKRVKIRSSKYLNTWTTSDQNKSWHTTLRRANSKSNCHCPIPNQTHIRRVPSLDLCEQVMSEQQETQHRREFIALWRVSRIVMSSSSGRLGET
jgi:hypothetical protein